MKTRELSILSVARKFVVIAAVGVAGAAVAGEIASLATEKDFGLLGVAQAQTAKEDDLFAGGEVSRAPAAASVRNGISRKRYAGGADEDDLQVQETLPIPTRNFDGVAASAAAESTSESSEPPPTSD